MSEVNLLYDSYTVLSTVLCWWYAYCTMHFWYSHFDVIISCLFKNPVKFIIKKELVVWQTEYTKFVEDNIVERTNKFYCLKVIVVNCSKNVGGGGEEWHMRNFFYNLTSPQII